MNEQYSFSPDKDWVSSRTPEWATLIADLVDKPVRMIEIGCFEGRSTIWWLDNLLTHPDSRILCIDPMQNPEVLATFLANLAKHPRLSKTSFVRNFSHKTLPGQPEQYFDFIYVDGSHEARDVILDACLAFRKLKPGGIILFDDYQWTGQHRYNNKVHLSIAIDAFIQTHDPFIEVIYKQYQVAIRKL